MAKGKAGYEEQREAELRYAEEYRRRLRRQKRSGDTDADSVLIDERAAAEERSRETVKAGLEAADARRRRTEEILRRSSERRVTDPTVGLEPEVPDELDWSPITHTGVENNSDINTSGESANINSEPVTYKVSVDGMSHSHSLYIDGMSFGNEQGRESVARESGASRVIGRGKVYGEYGFSDEVTDSVAEQSSTDNLDNVEFIERRKCVSDKTEDSDAASGEVADTKSRLDNALGGQRIGKTITETVKEEYRYTETDADLPEYERGASTPEPVDETHVEEAEYTEFLSKEIRGKRGACQENPDSSDNIKTLYTAPDEVFLPDEPEYKDGDDVGHAMTEEEDALRFERYYREADRLIKEKGDSPEGYHSEFEIKEGIGKTYHIDETEEPDSREITDEERRMDEETRRREMEREMLAFVREEDRRNRERKKTERRTPTVNEEKSYDLIFDRPLLTRLKKDETKRDIALIEARFNYRIREIENTRDKTEFVFSEISDKGMRDKKRAETDVKAMKSKLSQARYFETKDNDRYYQLVLTDLATVKTPKGANRERILELREKLMELLARRDELNVRLTALYNGSEKPGSQGGEAKREEEKRKARRKEYGRLRGLANRIDRERVAYDYRRKLFEMMDRQVELAALIRECEFILGKEKPKGERAKAIRKDLAKYKAEYRKVKAEIDRLSHTAFKKAKEQKEKKTGQIFGWIGFFILVAIIAVIVWQWDNIVAFVNENLPSIEDIIPDGEGTEGTEGGTDSDGTESGTEGGTDSDGTDGGTDAEGGNGDGTETLYHITYKEGELL